LPILHVTLPEMPSWTEFVPLPAEPVEEAGPDPLPCIFRSRRYGFSMNKEFQVVYLER